MPVSPKVSKDLQEPLVPAGEAAEAAKTVKSPRRLAKAAREIKEYAKRIERSHEYIGLFDLVTWCALRGREMVLVWGANEVNLIRDWHPQLTAKIVERPNQRLARIAGCKWDPDLDCWGALHEHVSGSLRHWVAAVRVGEELPPAAEREVEVCQSLDLQLQALGYVMCPTASQGDCGIDALCFWDYDCVAVRSPQWRALRRELSLYMLDHKDDPDWHEIFRCCWEDGAGEAPAKHLPRSLKTADKVVSSSDSSSDSSSESTDAGQDPPDDSSSDSEREREEDAALEFDTLVGGCGINCWS